MTNFHFRHSGTRLLHQIFQMHGKNDYIGEPVSQIQHMLQCGMNAEKQFPDDLEVIIGSFLHDIGHLVGLESSEKRKEWGLIIDHSDSASKGPNSETTCSNNGSESELPLTISIGGCDKMGDYGIASHELIGARFVTNVCGLSHKVAGVIKGHVAAKRYLVATDPEYYAKLSDASKQTLKYQGGPMNEGEIEEYKKEGQLELHLAVRRFDEAAKIPNMPQNEEMELERFLKLTDELIENGIRNRIKESESNLENQLVQESLSNFKNDESSNQQAYQRVSHTSDSVSQVTIQSVQVTKDGQSLYVNWNNVRNLQAEMCNEFDNKDSNDRLKFNNIDASEVGVRDSDSEQHTSQFNAIWLRDNDQSPYSKHPNNGQRLFNLVDIPEDLSIKSAKQTDDSKQIDIVFEGNQGQYSFQSTFSADFLWQNCYSSNVKRKRANEPRTYDGRVVPRILWRRSYIDSHKHILCRFFDWNKLQLNSNKFDYVERKLMLIQFVKFGFFLLDNVPVNPGQVLKIPSLFNGAVRSTNYGDLFDVKTEENPTNLAYTNAAVTPHTDNPYRCPVPSVQILHCLVNDCAIGEGATGLVDGFQAAERLREYDVTNGTNYFELLSKHFMTFVYKNVGNNNFSKVKDQAVLRHRQSLIQVDDTDSVIGISFNNRSAAPLESVPPEHMSIFYKAYRTFAKILFDEESQLIIHLKPGQAMVFDNTRILHMRQAFEKCEGTRWLQGCYADKDALFSEFGMLNSGEA